MTRSGARRTEDIAGAGCVKFSGGYARLTVKSPATPPRARDERELCNVETRESRAGAPPRARRDRHRAGRGLRRCQRHRTKAEGRRPRGDARQSACPGPRASRAYPESRPAFAADLVTGDAKVRAIQREFRERARGGEAADARGAKGATLPAAAAVGSSSISKALNGKSLEFELSHVDLDLPGRERIRSCADSRAQAEQHGCPIYPVRQRQYAVSRGDSLPRVLPCRFSRFRFFGGVSIEAPSDRLLVVMNPSYMVLLVLGARNAVTCA